GDVGRGSGSGQGHLDAGRRPAGATARDDAPGPLGGTAQGGSAWEGAAQDGASRSGATRQTGSARNAGSPRDDGGAANAVQPRDARPGLPGDFGPDPLGAPGGRGATADFLAAQPAGSILTTAPHQNRTARPAVATETIAAELAGWAAGELPGQASARLAAWAAIG